MPRAKSLFVRMRSSEIGCQKLGQPVPDSNFCPERKIRKPQAAQRK